MLESGGKHYGHLEVNIGTNPSGEWRAVLTPVHVFPRMTAGGALIDFERPFVIGNALVYRNTAHITATYMRTLVPWLGRRLPTRLP